MYKEGLSRFGLKKDHRQGGERFQGERRTTDELMELRGALKGQPKKLHELVK